MQAPPARGASSQVPYFFFFADFFAAFFFLAGINDHLPSFPSPEIPWRSEQSALTPGEAFGRPGADQPLLELSPWDPPDTTDPHSGYPRGVRVVHRAETAQDGRGVNAQAPGDLLRREVLVVACAGCAGCIRYV